MKKIICAILALAIVFSSVPALAATEDYSDVPSASWAKDFIYAARKYGLMSGVGGGKFGFGKEISRAEFATLLCNFMKWETVASDKPSFSDVPKTKWYYPYVETALIRNVMDKTEKFLPDLPILREEMAEMFVRALGLADAAKLAESLAIPFTDVTTRKGYIGVAYDINMTAGTSPTAFSPKAKAKREEAATMFAKVYERYKGKTQFLHGYYAFSSYSQRALTDGMDAVTLGWSAINLDSNGGVYLNTGTAAGNEWRIPLLYNLICDYLNEKGKRMHLGVYMDTTIGVNSLLLSPAKRSSAVASIISELVRTYPEIGKNPYSGVSIDFEGLKGKDIKEGFSAFLAELSAELKKINKALYVTVQPAVYGTSYFDGFDFRKIGELADKVILMAHDYNPTSLEGYVGTTWYKNTPLTPISKVYYSLKAITDKNTGVQDKAKLVLAFSFSTLGWEISSDNKLASPTSVRPDTETVYKRLTAPGTTRGFSETYRNPYIIYKAENGKNIFLWYENEQSIFEKAALARLFGINGISIWRIGRIPSYDGYNVMDSVR